MNSFKLLKNTLVLTGVLLAYGLQARDVTPTFAKDPAGNMIIKLVSQRVVVRFSSNNS